MISKKKKKSVTKINFLDTSQNLKMRYIRIWFKIGEDVITKLVKA
jgi:hypothetical protein